MSSIKTSQTIKSLTLYRAWADVGVYLWSPFVTKVEFHLRHAGIKYEVAAGSLSAAPKGKFPYVDLELDDGTKESIGDSNLIMRRLAELGLCRNLNAGLDARERAFDIGLRSLCEEKIYFLGGRERWIDNFTTQRDKVLNTFSWPLRIMISNIIYWKYVAMLNGQGTGRYSDEEARAMRRDCWQSIEDLLADSIKSAGKSGHEKSPFWALGGKEPTEADATLFGFINSGMVATSGPETKATLKTMPSITEYVDRIHERYFQDYEKWS